MNPILQHILATQEVQPAAGEAFPLHSHIPQLECEIIQQWLRYYHCRNGIEIGLAFGISALFICDVLQEQSEPSYHIFDPHQNKEKWRGIGLLNLERAGFLPIVTFHETYAEIGLPKLIENGHTCDFALIDGRHTFDQTLVDFFMINKLLTVGGIVIFDDLQLPSIQRVVAHVATYPSYERLDLPPEIARSTPVRVRQLAGGLPSRVAGFQKIAADQRPHDWYVDF